MRGFLKVMVLALIPLAGLAACNKKSDAATAGKPAYDTSAESNARFLADYAKRPGVTKLPDGLMYRVLQTGTGPSPLRSGDIVTVYYRGALITGRVFDQTHEEPAQFPAGGLIPGWVEALKLMKTGDTWELVIPPELGYGADGAGDGVIPPNQALVFTMKLVKVEYAN